MSISWAPCRPAAKISFPAVLFALAVGSALAASACGGGIDDLPPDLFPPEPPVIIQQPANQTVVAGQTATFSVTARGSLGNFRYQWFKNGNAVTIGNDLVPFGGVVTYTTPPATLADNGAMFTVRLRDDAGSVTSNPALLTVTAPVSPMIGQRSGESSAAAPPAFPVPVFGAVPLRVQTHESGGTACRAGCAPAIDPAEVFALRFTLRIADPDRSSSVTETIVIVRRDSDPSGALWTVTAGSQGAVIATGEFALPDSATLSEIFSAALPSISALRTPLNAQITDFSDYAVWRRFDSDWSPLPGPTPFR